MLLLPTIQSNYNLCMSRTELVGGWGGGWGFCPVYPTHPHKHPLTHTQLCGDSFLWPVFGSAQQIRDKWSKKCEDENGFQWFTSLPLPPSSTFSSALRPSFPQMDVSTKISFATNSYRPPLNCMQILFFIPRKNQLREFIPTVMKIKTKQRKRKRKSKIR